MTQNKKAVTGYAGNKRPCCSGFKMDFIVHSTDLFCGAHMGYL